MKQRTSPREGSFAVSVRQTRSLAASEKKSGSQNGVTYYSIPDCIVVSEDPARLAPYIIKRPRHISAGAFLPGLLPPPAGYQSAMEGVCQPCQLNSHVSYPARHRTGLTDAAGPRSLSAGSRTQRLCHRRRRRPGRGARQKTFSSATTVYTSSHVPCCFGLPRERCIRRKRSPARLLPLQSPREAGCPAPWASSLNDRGDSRWG